MVPAPRRLVFPPSPRPVVRVFRQSPPTQSASGSASSCLPSPLILTFSHQGRRNPHYAPQTTHYPAASFVPLLRLHATEATKDTTFRRDASLVPSSNEIIRVLARSL